MTLTVLKLPAHQSYSPSSAAAFREIEAEISCWDTAKLILAARRLRKDGTRGIRLGDIIDIHNHLADATHRTLPPDPTRDGRIMARTIHSLGPDRELWSDTLAHAGEFLSAESRQTLSVAPRCL